MTSEYSQSQNDSHRQRFMNLTQAICGLAAQQGRPITPYHDPSLPHFSKLKTAKKERVLQSLQLQHDYFVMGVENKLNLNSTQLVWRYLQKMNLVPVDNIFDKIRDDHTIEIYMLDGTSCFKNLNCFTHITMSLEELFVLPFHRIMRISLPGFLYFFELLARLSLGQVRKTFVPHFNRYVFQERLGQRRKIWIHLEYGSPLTREGQFCAIMMVNRNGPANETSEIGEIPSSEPPNSQQ